jgi:NAD-dependent dihydropyrimidine dehydrogenase PreA subunit
VVVVAHPVYGGDPPPIVKRFYTRLSKLYHGDVAVILTYGYVASISRRRERKFLSGSLRWFRGVKMVNNITTPEMPVRLPDAKTRTRRLARASRKLRRMARRVVSNRRGLPQVRPAAAAGPIVRRIMGNAVREHYRQVAVDRDRCVLCKLCVEQCPTNSITYREGGFDVADTCTACMACYNFCPVQAITVGGVYADPERYPRYRGPELGLTREHGVGRDHR